MRHRSWTLLPAAASLVMALGACGDDMGGAGGGAGEETGRVAGMTDAHNAARASVATATPLPPLAWSSTLAEYAQAWADTLAQTCSISHRPDPSYGENLAAFYASPSAPNSTPTQVVDAWMAEEACYTLGSYAQGDACDSGCAAALNSTGCGHYTQIAWRETTHLGCGFASCVTSEGWNGEVWVCNYDPPGNVVGVVPF